MLPRAFQQLHPSAFVCVMDSLLRTEQEIPGRYSALAVAGCSYRRNSLVPSPSTISPVSHDRTQESIVPLRVHHVIQTWHRVKPGCPSLSGSIPLNRGWTVGHLKKS